MSVRLTAWIVGALALVFVLSFVAPGLVLFAVFALAVPVAVGVKLLGGRRAEGGQQRDAAQTLLSAAATFSGDRTPSSGGQVDWHAALRAELASITVPRERLRFALGAAAALLGAPRRFRSFLVAAGVALVFATVLLGFARATVGQGGVGSLTMLLPPVVLFATGWICARRTRSLRFGVETGILAAATTLAAVAVVLGVEAAHWFDVAHVSIFDGDYANLDTPRAAALDAVHPIILLVHLVFWLPGPMLGAIVGVRTRRRATPSAPSAA